MIETNSAISLGAAIIAKDAALTIERTISSITPYVKQIVIVDTGSKDKTATIAAKLGAEVYYNKWRNSFSEARNYALKHVRTDWILNIDTDEELVNFYWDKVFTDNKLGGINVIMNNRLSDSGDEYVTKHRYTRIVRNSKSIFFTGSIHEQIASQVSASGLKIAESNIEILHHGYYEKDNQRYLRNIELLQKDIQHNTDDSFLKYHLGQSYFAIGDNANAEEYFKDSLLRNDLTEMQQSLALIRLAQICIATDNIKTALHYTNFETTDKDTDAFRRYVRAAAMLSTGNWEEAFNLYKSLLNNNYNYIDYRIVNQAIAKLEELNNL